MGRHLTGILKKLTYAEELEIAARLLTSGFKTAFHENLPLKEVREKCQTPWWNGNLEILRRKRRSPCSEAVRIKLNSDGVEFGRVMVEYRCSFFCSTKKAVVPRLDKILSNNSHPILGSVKWSGGRILETDEHTGQEDTNLNKEGAFGQTVGRRISYEEKLQWANISFRPCKSRHLDGNYPALLQRATKTVIRVLKGLPRFSPLLAHIPLVWKRLVSIPKENKLVILQQRIFIVELRGSLIYTRRATTKETP